MSTNRLKYIFLSLLFCITLSSFSQSASEILEKGNKFYKSGDFKKASKYFSKAIESDTLLIEAYFKKAYSEYNIAFDKFEESYFLNAVHHLSVAISIDSTKANAYYKRGNAKFELANFSLSSDNDSLTEQLAIEAITDFKKAILLDSSFSNLSNTIGIIESNLLGETSNSLNSYSNAIENRADQFEPYWNRANLRFQEKNYKGAIEDYKEVIRITANKPNENLFLLKSYVNLGDCKAQLGEYNSAIIEYSKALELHPKYYLAFYHRGLAKYKLNDKVGACSDLKKAKIIAKTDFNKYCK